MALKAFVESLDGIDESLHEHYTEKDGGFYLALDDFGKHPGALTLKTTLNKVNRDKDALAAKVTEIEEKLSGVPEDFDGEEWARLKALGDTGDPDAKKRFDEQLQSQKQILEQKLANQAKKHETDMAALNEQLSERDGYIDRTLADAGLKDALVEVGVKTELFDGAFSSLRGSVKVVRGDDGDRRAIVETDLGEVDIPSFVKDWSQTKGKPYLGTASPMDARGNNGGRASTKTMTRTEFDRMDAAAKASVDFTKVSLVD